jgi:hypothetical protein
MKNKLTRLALTLLAVASLLLVSGCSDDDDDTGLPWLPAGNQFFF